MPQMWKNVSEQLKTGIISIDSYTDKKPEGRLLYPHFTSEYVFSNLMQLIDGITNAISELGYTSEFCETRSFGAKPQAVAPGENKAQEVQYQRGKLATFRIKIVFLQNASWQGVIVWEETGDEQNFRSALEMFRLIDSALEN